MHRRLRWAAGMTVFALVVAACVGALTGSLGWVFVGLLAAGVVANVIARPARTSTEP